MTPPFFQKTLSGPVSFTGVGVHSGRTITLTLLPAPENHGVKFRRVDIPGSQDIPALFKLVVDTSLATVLGANGAIVSTIEHLMACFSGLGVDNALVEINDYEVPVMDGSAWEFTKKIKTVGVRQQGVPKQCFIIKEEMRVSDGDKFVAALPAPFFSVTCAIDFDHPLIGEQKASFNPAEDDFETEISRARTFGFVRDFEMMKRLGLGAGGGLDNAIVVDDAAILNEEGLRYPDEFVRHKLLDCLGDFSLLGMPIQGRIITRKSGHTLNHQFISHFLENKDAWETGPVGA
jgi:UDP-3-O-[3-hydroxymyristoyl] N-acetylglucosamine deacetylase